MGVDFKIDHLLIDRILRHDNLSYIKGMLNRTEDSQAIENQISLKEINKISVKIIKSIRKFK